MVLELEWGQYMASGKNIRMAKSGSKLTSSILLKVESSLGLKFPHEYVKFMMRNNGGIPTPGYFDWKHGKRLHRGSWVQAFCPLQARPSSLDVIWCTTIAHSPEQIEYTGGLPKEAVVIGYTGPNDDIVMYCDGPRSGQVWIKYKSDMDAVPSEKLKPESGMHKLADAFNRFLEMLYDGDG